MSTETCSVSSCTNPGTLRCTGCTAPLAKYCSKKCQKNDWMTHKPSCAAAQKSNCYIIRASALASETSAPTVAHCIEPFNLQAYGNEWGEMEELRRRLGWAKVEEAGKFYNHKGADIWYYFVYGQGTTSKGSLSKNEIATRCTGSSIFGDVAVVRSGPADSSNYPTSFSKGDLTATAEFYKTRDSRSVFAEREQSRAMRKWGLTS